MMKKYLKLILALLLTVNTLSCVDLEEKPEGLLAPETFFSSPEAFEAAVVGCYKPLYGVYAGHDTQWQSMMGSIAAEDVATTPGDDGGLNSLNFDPAFGRLNTTWGMYYKSLTNANALVGNIKTASSEIPQAVLDESEGQARFIRAFDYFQLTRYFGEIPIVTWENQKNADKVGQSTVNEIYAFIIEDLKIAEEKLQVSYSEKGKATKGAAKALLAKVYLTAAGWPIEDPSYYELARDKAKEVIDLGVYQLENDFRDLWLTANKTTNSEFIFTLHGSPTRSWLEASHLHVATRPSVEKGWANTYSEARFYNAFPEGPRKDVSFHTEFNDGTNWQDVAPNQPFIAKYRDAGPEAATFESDAIANDGEGFFVLLRYADVLLMYAEAANMAESGPSPEALEAINKVRRRAMGLDPNTPDAGVDLVAMSQSDFDDAVIAERNWELAFENNRWFDLVRKKMVVEVNQAVFPNVSEHNRLFPKPALQVDLTEGLEQNPGY